MKPALLVAGAVLVVATFLPLLRHDRWWVRILDFPRIQLAVAILIVSGGLLYHWDTLTGLERGVLAALFASVIQQVYWMAPFTPLAPKEVVAERKPDPQSSVKVLVSNVLISNTHYGKLLELVREKDPDLVLVLEADDRWEEELRPLEVSYAHTAKKPQDNTYGMILYSRLELIDPRIEFLTRGDVPSVHAQVRLASGETIHFHGLHPEPPYPRYATHTKRRDAELLLVGKRVKQQEEAAIVAGDLNDVAWSHTTRLFRKISGMLDPRIGRGPLNTFHSGHPLLRCPLDHVFLSPSFSVVALERLRKIGSDHFPVFAHVCYHRQPLPQQEEPIPTTEEKREAAAKISEGKKVKR